MIYKVGILGASGKMGLAISNLLTDGFESEGHSFELGDAIAGSGKLTSLEGVPVRKLSEPAWQPVHVWIDFSRPEATLKLLREIETPIVIGTTGFTEAQKKEIEAFSRERAVLLSSNTSPGISLMSTLLEGLRRGPAWSPDVILEESHHRQKVDAPSGTAKSLLSILAENGFNQVQVHSTRAGGIRGEHTVRFVTDQEEIAISHRVFDRAVFARGALLGASFLLAQKKAGLYSMQEVWANKETSQ